MKNIKYYLKAFTLVELIIVISILAILATVAFISFQNYAGNARDSIRVTDIKTIYNGLSLLKVKTGILPKPDNGIEIKVGEEKILTYQGEAGIGIRNQIKINGSAQDPKDKSNYIYSTDKKIDKIQLMGYLESGDSIKYISNLPNIIKEAYANGLDYTNKYVYVYGDQIGIITNDKKVPINLLKNTGSGFNILDQKLPLITYFGGDVYENGKSTSTGNTLALQLDAGLSGTLPCSSQTYNGYNITALSHGETKVFTKEIEISNGNQIKQFTLQCKNGNLDIGNANEIISETTCSTNGYVSYNNQCIENKCQNNIPDNASSNSLNNDPNITYHLIPWSHNLSGGYCTFICNSGYTFNNDSNNPVCIDQTPPTITDITSAQLSCNNIRFTINGANDNGIGLHSSSYSFDGGVTWQVNNYKDQTGTSYTINANLIKVRDNNGNIYTYTASISGTSSSCDSTPPVLSNLGPTGTVVSANQTLSLTTDETATCKYSSTNINYDSMTNTFTTTNLTNHSTNYTAIAGNNTLYVRCMDIVGNKHTSSSTINFVYDGAAPTGGNFTINEASSTYSQNITLNITCPSDISTPIKVAYGNTHPPTNWTNCYSGNTTFTLSSGVGTKTVYMRFRDNVGNTTTDITKTITLNNCGLGTPGSQCAKTNCCISYRSYGEQSCSGGYDNQCQNHYESCWSTPGTPYNFSCNMHYIYGTVTSSCTCQ